MHVRIRDGYPNGIPRNEEPFISPSQVFLSPLKDYEVHAVSVFKGVTFVQIVDDKDTPIFLPRALFRTTSHALPDDWICSVFPEGAVQLILGPTFVADSISSYNAMIDQEVAQVQRFWRRLDLAAQTATLTDAAQSGGETGGP
jgi:hypothetical protein